MLGTCTSLFMLSKKWIIQILYYSCNKVKYISTVCNMYPTILHIVIFQQNNEVHLWHIFKSFFAISSLLKVLWIPISVLMFCKSVDRKLYQTKHEYLRSCAYICLSLSSHHHPDTFLSNHGLSRYSCLHFGSLHPRIYSLEAHPF